MACSAVRAPAAPPLLAADADARRSRSRSPRAAPAAVGGVVGGAGEVRLLRAGAATLLIIRHGETVWNAEGRIQGQLDISLNDSGRAQARAAAAALRRLGLADRVDAVVSSDLARASETADLIRAGACPRATRATDPGLREINFGKLQGMTSANKESKALKDGVYNKWRAGDFSQSFPGGENCESLMSRGLAALRAAARLGSCVVVVAHGGLIKWSAVAMAFEGRLPSLQEAMAKMARAEMREILDAPVRNCCCSTVHFDHAGAAFRPRGWFQSVFEDASAKDDTG